MFLNKEKPNEAGYYFLTFHLPSEFTLKPEVILDKIKINKNNELISYFEDENISFYENSAFSVKLPSYITNKFIKVVNDFIVSNQFDVLIDFKVNDIDFLDESFAVFIRSGDFLNIFTINIKGKIDVVSIYGKESIKALSNMAF